MVKWWILAIEFRRIEIASVVTEDCAHRLVELWTFLNAKKMTGYIDHCGAVKGHDRQLEAMTQQNPVSLDL